jgi:hypothetical protein
MLAVLIAAGGGLLAAAAMLWLLAARRHRVVTADVDELRVIDAYNRALFAGKEPGAPGTFEEVARELGIASRQVRDVIARGWRS